MVTLFAGGFEQDRLRELIEQPELKQRVRPPELISIDGIANLGSGKSDFSHANSIALEAAPS